MPKDNRVCCQRTSAHLYLSLPKSSRETNEYYKFNSLHSSNFVIEGALTWPLRRQFCVLGSLINSSRLTVSLSHHHCEVFHGSVGVTEPAAVDSEVDGGFADQHILLIHTDMRGWWRRAWKTRWGRSQTGSWGCFLLLNRSGGEGLQSPHLCAAKSVRLQPPMRKSSSSAEQKQAEKTISGGPLSIREEAAPGQDFLPL